MKLGQHLHAVGIECLLTCRECDVQSRRARDGRHKWFNGMHLVF